MKQDSIGRDRQAGGKCRPRCGAQRRWYVLDGDALARQELSRRLLELQQHRALQQ